MVGYLMLLKMLHSNHNLHKKRMSDNATLNQTNNKSLKSDARRRIKKERYDPEEPGMCRVCLKEGNIPIYGNETYEDVSEALCTFGDITVSSNDNYTKFLCLVCHEFLQKAIEFRKKAKQSDETIRWQQVESYLDNENEIADNIHDDVSSGNEETGKEEHNYFCRKCVRGFKTFKEYSEHRLSAEHENVRHKCPICNKLYTALYIKKHMLLHKMERQYMCDICGKKFPLQAPFNRHRLTHFYSLPFQCTLCPYKGRFRESLKMHMRSHTGEKPYQCSQCPSRFVNASNLNKHMLTHTRNHNFKCDMCGRGFYTKRDLGSHFKVDHSGIKEHTCNMCGKAFGYRKQMMKHQLVVHKREKLRSGRLPLYLQVESQSNAVGD